MQVLFKAALQFLTMLPDIRPKVRVIAECGNWYMRLYQFPMREHLWVRHYVVLLDACRRSCLETTEANCRP